MRDSKQVYEDEHLRARKSVWIFDDPVYENMVAAGSPAKLSKSPGRIKWVGTSVGYHNRYIFKKLLGLSEEEIEELIKEGVICYWADAIGRRPPKDFDYESDPVFRW